MNSLCRGSDESFLRTDNYLSFKPKLSCDRSLLCWSKLILIKRLVTEFSVDMLLPGPAILSSPVLVVYKFKILI